MKRIIVNIFFIVLWTVMALLLAVSAILICSVRLLKPEHLTPIVERLANRTLDADVEVGKVELSFRPAFPVLNIEVDSLTVLSHAFTNLSPEERTALPVYADTLLTLDRFSGALDLGALIKRGEIGVRDVELIRPGVNIVLDRHGRGNFDIYQAAEDTVESSSPAPIPPFSISRFAMVEPREIRYFNAADSTDATVMLLHDIVLDGSATPLYTLRIDGHLFGPYPQQFLQAQDIHFGLDGRVRWAPLQPEMLALEEFTIKGAFATAHLSTELKYDSTLTVNSGRLEIEPIAIEDALTVLPDSIRRSYGLVPRMFATDGRIGLTARLTKPYSPATDSIPYMDMNINMPDCSMRYGKADLRKLGFDIDLSTKGNCLDSTVIVVNRFTASGPATALHIKGRAWQLAADPAFEAEIKGDMQLRRLPPIVANMARGFIDGRLKMQLNARGRMSMLSQEKFHSLDVRGNLSGNKLYYLSNDTSVMTEINELSVRFGSRTQIKDSTGETNPTLTAGISADTANILIDGVSITVGGLELGAGVENNGNQHDTTLIVPIGGRLKLGRLNIESVTDSAGVRLRNLAGHVGVKRFHGNKRLPLLSAKLDIGRLAAGTPDTRFMISNAHLDASMYRRPEVVERYKEIKHISDSIQQQHPELSPDSVYRLAIEKRRLKPGTKRQRRVRSGVNEDDYEVIEWDLTKGMRKFMYNWQVEGSLSTRSARLFTPLFPLRNRIRQLDLAFSSDSVELRGVKYRAGRSDLALNGLISNIRRALTSKKAGNSLKINLEINSDTIDVNQLSAAAFAGAAYAERLRKGEAKTVDISGSEDELERQLDALVSEDADSVGPLLVPTNIDGRIKIASKNVVYSDLLLRNLHGQILVFGGGVNLHDLAATSDAGSVSISALYSAPKARDMKFGFGMQLNKFKIERFLKLVPAVDSIMPLMRDFSGIINADIAATVDIDSTMNMVLPTLDAAIKLSGDSLAFINPETYRTLGKWLRFRDRADNKIKHASVEFLVRDNKMQTFPFSFDIDRYRLGIVGTNDLALNFNYHISVLKSPLPFKFGINIKGNPDDFKVRFGGAKFKEGMAVESVNIVDTARVNLIKQIEGVFRRGVQNSRFARLDIKNTIKIEDLEGPEHELSHADSLALQREGLIPANTVTPPDSPTPEAPSDNKENTEAYIKKDDKQD